MEKERISWAPGTMIYPLPAILVSCGADEKEYNALTVSWVGTICSSPAMCYISVRPERHSYEIIKRTGEFVLNLTTEQMAFATDWCGVKSGKDFNKFKEMNLTIGAAEKVKAPIVLESPINIECKVCEVINLGSHDMFLADIVNVRADERLFEGEKLCINRAHLCAFAHGEYYELSNRIGKFGFSVKKK